MPYSTINKSTDHFNTKLYTGTGSENALTGIGFQPDWVWIKSRASANHREFDAVRGATKALYPNLSNAQGTAAQELKSFDSDGFTLGTEANVNANSTNFVSWNWKANGAGSANSSGTATNCTVSANTTAGVSVVKWTSSSSALTVPHGLGVAPKVIIMKEIEDSGNWIVGGFGLDWNGYLILSGTQAFYNSGDASSGSGRMFKAGGTEPTSTLFHTNGSAYMGSTSNNVIGYFFAEKTGFSKFGSYVGNGSTNGSFIYTGFKPAFLMIKIAVGNTGGWDMFDNKRDTFNPTDQILQANSNVAEADSDDIDFLSNGFKIRNTSGNHNGSGNTFVYMAFAEAPLVGSNNVPCTAR